MNRYRKLSPVKVRAIRKAWAVGAFQKELAVRFGVSVQSVSAIVSGRIWGDVPDEDARAKGAA